MEIKTLFFGITADFVGSNSQLLNCEENITIKELKETLITCYPDLKNINDFAIAVNEEYAEDDTILQLNDVVAIIPPVSGG
jgi:molybdopterin converting factor subunit 1